MEVVDLQSVNGEGRGLAGEGGERTPTRDRTDREEPVGSSDESQSKV